MRHRDRGLAVPIMDGMHSAVILGDLGSIEPSRCERVWLLIEACLSKASSCQLGESQSELVVFGLVSWDVPLVAWDVEVLLANWSTLHIRISFENL